jgi:arylsulfatase A-like enzyme
VAFFSTAHFPYASPYPYHCAFTDPGYAGRFRYAKANLLGRDEPPSAQDVHQVRGLYDGGVLAADTAIGAVLDGLAARGLSESTIVVLTADHGEQLFEEGRGQGHGDHLFGDQTTHVPLVIHDPRRPERRRIGPLARDVDLAPTLLELAGIAAPASLDGRSLVPALRGEPLAPALAFAETGLWFTRRVPGVPPERRMPYGDLTDLLQIDREHADDLALRPELELPTVAAKHRMVRDARYKLVYVPSRSGAEYLLYDTERDPEELRNVIAVEPGVTNRLRDELWRFMLRDTRFERRGELLVPRPEAWLEARGAARGLRIEARP